MKRLKIFALLVVLLVLWLPFELLEYIRRLAEKAIDDINELQKDGNNV